MISWDYTTQYIGSSWQPVQHEWQQCCDNRISTPGRYRDMSDRGGAASRFGFLYSFSCNNYVTTVSRRCSAVYGQWHNWNRYYFSVNTLDADFVWFRRPVYWKIGDFFRFFANSLAVFVNSKSHGLAINMTSFFHGGPVVRWFHQIRPFFGWGTTSTRGWLLADTVDGPLRNHQLIDCLSHDFVGVLTILLVVQDFAGPSTGHLALYMACGEKPHFSGRCPYRLITNDYRVSYYWR